MIGWIALHRTLASHDLWLSEKFTRGQAWVDLLMLANHKDGFIRVRGIRVHIKRGQLGWSETKLAERWKWSRGKVRSFLHELEIEQQIDLQNNPPINIISIIKYGEYQNNGHQNIQQNDQQTDQQTEHQMSQQNDTNNNDKNDKNDKKTIYSDFYDSEIGKSNNNENYIKIVKILFGENNLGVNLSSVLKMDQQLSYMQFKTLWYLKEKYKFSIIEILEDMENWKKLNGNKTVYKTFLTFAKRRNPAIELK